MNDDRLQLGSFTIHGLRDGFFYLDGGAMFGVVPRILWEKLAPPDEKNRIKMGLNSLLISDGNTHILVDTGFGTLLKPKFYEHYGMERKPGLIEALQSEGLSVEDIDFVINTHLHFDHCGWNTRRNEAGEIVPTFPNAVYVVQKGEWDDARNPCLRDKSSYVPESFLPLEIHGRLELVEGEQEIIPGVRVVPVPGHTSFHQCVEVESGGGTLFFLAELVPTSAHVGLSYIMSYDLYPVETLESKIRIFEQAIREHWIIAFDHDPVHFFGRIGKKNDKYVFLPLSSA